jgi:uncharacterized PurR-regulated membrane protein YhhQ (DUF165 family)
MYSERHVAAKQADGEATEKRLQEHCQRFVWVLAEDQAMTAIFQLVIFYPPSAVMKNNPSYVDVLSTAPRLVLFGTLAMFARRHCQ